MSAKRKKKKAVLPCIITTELPRRSAYHSFLLPRGFKAHFHPSVTKNRYLSHRFQYICLKAARQGSAPAARTISAKCLISCAGARGSMVDLWEVCQKRRQEKEEDEKQRGAPALLGKRAGAPPVHPEPLSSRERAGFFRLEGETGVAPALFPKRAGAPPSAAAAAFLKGKGRALSGGKMPSVSPAARRKSA